MLSRRSLVMLLLVATGTVAIAQPINQGLFHSPSQWVTVHEATSTNLPVFTLETWLYCTNRQVIAARDMVSAIGSDWSLIFNWDLKCLEFMTQIDGALDTYYFSAPNSLKGNTWQHVAIVVNGPRGTIRGYVDGASVMNETFVPRSFNVQRVLSWAAFSDGGSGGNGILDECRYWSVERTQAQIDRARNTALSPSDRDGLVGYWRFCYDYADSSGNHNDLQVYETSIIPVPELASFACCSGQRTSGLSIMTDGNTNLCVGETVRLSANSGFTQYRWSTGATTQSITISVPGTYTVQATKEPADKTDAFCFATASMTVHGKPPPTPEIKGPKTLCRNSVACLQATGGYLRYLWSTGDSGSLLCSSTPGLYSVSVTDSNGCSGVATYMLSMDAAELSIAGPKEICPGESAVLSATAGFLSYRWSNGDSTRSTIAHGPSLHRVIAVTPDGCIDTAELSIAERRLSLVISASGPLRLCLGDSLTLTASDGFASYLWSTGATSRSIVAHQAGVYSVTVKDTFGCSGYAVVSLLEGVNRTPIINGTTTICDGDSTILDVGAGWHTHQWSTGDSTRTLMVKRPGIYSVIVSSDDGCQAIATASVQLAMQAQPHITGKRAICEGDSTVLRADGDIESCLWSTGDTTRSICIRTPGRYFVTATRAGLCPGGADTVVITTSNKPSPKIVGAASFCVGDTALFSVHAIAGHQYRWTTNDARILGNSDGSSVVILWLSEGSRVVSLLESIDSSSCADSARITVTVHPLPRPVITALGTLRFCDGDSVILDAGDGYAHYLWSDGSGARRVTVRRSGVYLVSVTNAEGCEATSAEVTVTALPKPSVFIAGPLVLCTDATGIFQIEGTDSMDVEWRAPGGTVLNGNGTRRAEIRWSTTGAAIVTAIVSRNGCIAADSLLVQISSGAQLALRATPGTQACAGDTIRIDAGIGYASYQWHDLLGRLLDTARVFATTQSGTYIVTASDGGPCPASGRISVGFRAAPVPTISGPERFCEGDTITLDGGAGYAAWNWSDGSSNRMLRLAQSGAFTVRVRDSGGCTGTSKPFTVQSYPKPAPPLLTRHGDTLRCTLAWSYQWHRNGSGIPGATGNTLIATEDGLYTVRVGSEFGCEAEAHLEVLAPQIIVQLPFLTVAPGESFEIPVTLRASEQLASLEVTGFRGTIRWDGGVAHPTEAMYQSHMEGTDRVIVLESTAPVLESTLARIRCTATLGARDRSRLHFDSIQFTGQRVRVTVIDGELRLNICREGGMRLFDASGTFRLEQNSPNPFNASTRIDFELIESTTTRLLVYDLLGRVVATLLDDVLAAGEHTIFFEASQLSSGVYTLVLQTGNATLTRLMLVQK